MRVANTISMAGVVPISVAVLAASLAQAQAAHAVETGASAEARRTTGPIVLDGRLDEADWASAPALSQFYEYYPGDLSAPHDHTEARFLYDDSYLYVAFRADLTEREGLRTPFVRRDRVGASHDYVQVYLDPLGARRSAYIFRVNARGVKTDGLRDEAGQSETLDPDFDWDTASSIDDHGWSAELRIPLSTLRIDRAGPQIWSVIVTRGVPRAQNTQMATALFPRDASCFLCYASVLAFPDLRPHMENVITSASGSILSDEDRAGDVAHRELRAEPSLDVKWLPYAGAAIDVTVNPDFSQVEADSPQLTANERFALNLPEKRPFFREAGDLISTPIPAIYTRAIAAPDVGVRFTHRASVFNATGFVASDSGRPAIIEPGLLTSDLVFPDFDSTVAFVRGAHNRGAAEAGLMYVGKFNADGSRNSVAGADYNWGDGENRISAQVLGSWTQAPDRPDLLASWRGQDFSGEAAFVRWDHTARAVWALQYTRYDDGFRSWIGLVPRVGYEDLFVDLRTPFYLSNNLINYVTPYVDYEHLAGLSFDEREGGPVVGVSIGAVRNSSFDLALHPDAQVLTETGQALGVSYLEWTASTNPAPRVPLMQLNGRYGESVDFATDEVVPGWSIDAALRLRPIDRLELEARYAMEGLGDGVDGKPRLLESGAELLTTVYFGANFYVLGDYQLHRTDVRLPVAEHSRRTGASLQFVWAPSRAWQAYWGVRSLETDATLPNVGARSMEYYFKFTRTFGARF